MGKAICKDLPENVMALIKEKNIDVLPLPIKKHQTEKYAFKKHTLYLRQDQDLLKYMMVVRPFILRKHSITIGLLEFLLYLNSMRVFTYTDYNAIPKSLTYKNMKWFFDRDLINIKIEDKKVRFNNIYQLTHKAKAIINEYYGLLAGEIAFDVENRNIKKLSKKFKNWSQLVVLMQKLNSSHSNPLHVYFE
jgi:hypothetical protein